MVWNWSRCSHKYALQFFFYTKYLEPTTLETQASVFFVWVGECWDPIASHGAHFNTELVTEKSRKRFGACWNHVERSLPVAVHSLHPPLYHFKLTGVSPSSPFPLLFIPSLSSLTFPIPLVSSLAFSHSTWPQNHSSKWLWSPPLLISLSSLLLLCRAPLHFPVSQQLPPDASSLRHWGLQYYQVEEELSAVLW